MCTEAIIENSRGRVFVRSCGELARQLGTKPKRLPRIQGPGYNYPPPRPRDCLCGIDFARIAKLRGYKMKNLGWEPPNFGEIELIEG